MVGGSAPVPKRSKAIVDAVDVILRRLAKLPDGAEAQELREKALACLRIARTWEGLAPTPAQREGVAKTVLALHTRARRMKSARPPRPED
jgi:hypothetical protein